MLENLRRKSLTKTYNDPTHLVRFEQGHAIYLGSYHIEQYKQKISKKAIANSFPSTFETLDKGFWVISNTLEDVKFNMIFCSISTFIKSPQNRKPKLPKLEAIERPFLLGETEITQELYQAVMGYNLSGFKNPQNPVENVSWYDAILFCNELSKLQGLECCYDLTYISTKNIDGVDQNRIMSAKVTCNFSKNGYRLPTEKEWEYAAKAGTNNLYAGTDNAGKAYEYIVGSESLKWSTEPVKTKKPNEWGFYDMTGNVNEWCWDKNNPTNLAFDAYRKTCGGNWSTSTSSNTISSRFSMSPNDRYNRTGFRVCRTVVS